MNHNDIQNTGNDSVSSQINVGRKVVLVALNWARDKDPRTPLGHACLAAALRRAKRELKEIIVPVNQDCDVDALASEILAEERSSETQDIDLGIGAYIWGEAVIQELLPKLRGRGFQGRIILGGPQISFMEEGFEAVYPDADVFIRGNAEAALVAVTETREQINFQGVYYAQSKRPSTMAVAILEQYPSPWLNHDWEAEPVKFVRMETMRGCPYSCSFCQHRAPERGKRPNYHSESRVFSEIDLFCKNGVESIAILDPIFNSSPRAAGVLERFLRNGYQGKISVQCRPEILNEDFLAKASQLNITLEFGLQTIHENESVAINRRNKIEKVYKWLEVVRSHGIHHEVSLIFGLPEQTLESFKQSVDWCLSRRVPVIRAFPLMLLRGTELEAKAHKWGLKQSDSKIPFVLSSDSFSSAEWAQMNAISQALKDTEGTHPESIGALLDNAKSCHETARWTPM